VDKLKWILDSPTLTPILDHFIKCIEIGDYICTIKNKRIIELCEKTK
jgi:hypothetical protein